MRITQSRALAVTLIAALALPIAGCASGRAAKGDLTSPAFFGIVLGIWSLKLILFFVLSLWLRTQDWLEPATFGFTAIGAVLGSLVADALAFLRSRVPLDVALPGDEGPAA